MKPLRPHRRVLTPRYEAFTDSYLVGDSWNTERRDTLWIPVSKRSPALARRAGELDGRIDERRVDTLSLESECDFRKSGRVNRRFQGGKGWFFSVASYHSSYRGRSITRCVRARQACLRDMLRLAKGCRGPFSMTACLACSVSALTLKCGFAARVGALIISGSRLFTPGARAGPYKGRRSLLRVRSCDTPPSWGPAEAVRGPCACAAVYLRIERCYK